MYSHCNVRGRPGEPLLKKGDEVPGEGGWGFVRQVVTGAGDHHQGGAGKRQRHPLPHSRRDPDVPGPPQHQRRNRDRIEMALQGFEVELPGDARHGVTEVRLGDGRVVLINFGLRHPTRVTEGGSESGCRAAPPSEPRDGSPHEGCPGQPGQERLVGPEAGRIDEHQAADLLRSAERGQRRDLPAHRVADQNDVVQTKRIEQIDGERGVRRG